MSIDNFAPIMPITPIAEPASATLRPVEAGPQGVGFGAWFDSTLAKVNADLTAADAGARVLASGGSVPLHDVMMRMEEARLELQLMLQVRNRLLEAYQDVIKQQI